MKRLLAALAVSAALAAAGGTGGRGDGRRLLEFGWDMPSTEALRRDVRQMEKAPFDGVVLDVALKGRGSVAWTFWTPDPWRDEDLAPARDDLRATRFRRFSDNFLRLNVAPGRVDWFDPAFSAIVTKAAQAARFVRQAGLRGILLDPEQYDGIGPFDFGQRPLRGAQPFVAYAAQARARGRELMAAMAAEHPNLTILTLFGHSLAQAQLPYALPPAPGDPPVSGTFYALLPAFLDGLLEAAPPGFLLHDVHELSYPYKTEAQFARAVENVRRAAALSAVPDAYARHVRVGFGIWIDYDSGRRGWHPDAPERNHFRPAELERALRAALAASDRYVWIYSERLNWWTGENLPVAYRHAVMRARRPARDYTRRSVAP